MGLNKSKKLSITKQELVNIEKSLINIADGENIIADDGNIVYHDKFKYKHTFADGIYVRQMTIEQGEIIIGAIHKHLHVWFLLTGSLTIGNKESVEDYIAPCYVISKPGAQRAIYANEDSIFVNIHKNPTNTQDLDELEAEIVSINYEEYEKYIN